MSKTLLSYWVVKTGFAYRGLPAALLLILSSQAVNADPRDLMLEKLKLKQLEKSVAMSGVPHNHPKHLKSQDLYHQGRGEMDDGRYGRAIGLFTAYIALHKQESKSIKNENKASHDYYLSWGYQNRAWCYIQLRDFGKAIDDLTDAIKLRPTYSPNYKNRAQCYKLTGRRDLAQRDLDAIPALPKNTNDVDADLAAEFPAKKKRQKSLPR